MLVYIPVNTIIILYNNNWNNCTYVVYTYNDISIIRWELLRHYHLHQVFTNSFTVYDITHSEQRKAAYACRKDTIINRSRNSASFFIFPSPLQCIYQPFIKSYSNFWGKKKRRKNSARIGRIRSGSSAQCPFYFITENSTRWQCRSSKIQLWDASTCTDVWSDIDSTAALNQFAISRARVSVRYRFRMCISATQCTGNIFQIRTR